MQAFIGQLPGSRVHCVQEARLDEDPFGPLLRTGPDCVVATLFRFARQQHRILCGRRARFGGRVLAVVVVQKVAAQAVFAVAHTLHGNRKGVGWRS